MHFVYIKNYLKISKEHKMEFFRFINDFEKFKFSNQKIILKDNSLLLEFTKDSDIKSATEEIKGFFTKYEYDYVDVTIVDKILKMENELILVFGDDSQKRIAI
jgi:hypothetical protein